ncbi:MAG TPA: bifunctional YncE family protein/alkaline phosphatase family protein [Gemmatimonadales bacterium]|nr:bifunctional YncE family protein/alkaline phosphatase family protein [Gemmatimonadales bacterium]
MNRSLATLALLVAACGPHAPQEGSAPGGGEPRLPTGRSLDPAGVTSSVGQMPLGMVASPDGRRLVLLLGGWREHGLQVVDRTGRVTQTLPQSAAFVGLVFSSDGRVLYASGGNTDVVYRYRWTDDTASLADSIVLAPRAPRADGSHYPAGLALSADGRSLYVAENLADSLAVVDLASGAVVQRLATGRYPYGVASAADGTVFVSNWGANTLSVFTPAAGGRLAPARAISTGRHPSALILNRPGTRLFVASGSTDRVAVVDTRSRAVVSTLLDPPPAGPDEGTTPDALALSADGTRLFAAEADANAVAVFDLAAATADAPAATGNDRLAGRIPVGWYPTSLMALRDTLLVANGKGAGTGPNPAGPQAGRPRAPEAVDTGYTLGQIKGSLTIVPAARASGGELAALTQRVARANRWDERRPAGRAYPPITHVVYVLRENRTYDQVLGDLPRADGDTSLVLFGREVTPNAHALAERFGIFDRFFVNAEVSADGHNWSMAAYATDYTEKTAPINYSHTGGRSYDFQGENRGQVPDDDVAEPAAGYLWDLAARARIDFANFGEFTREESEVGEHADTVRWYRGLKAFLAAHTDTTYPGWNLEIRDQHRIDVWLRSFRRWMAAGSMPALQIVYLPQDHTSGGAAGASTPRAMVADNDLALGRLVDALSHSPFWKNTVVFVMEDDAQNGPDHVDSHRSPLLVISPYTQGGVLHRFTNTTDVLRTMEEILRLDALSQFDHYGHPLRDVWRDAPDTTPFTALTPSVPLDERNPAGGRAARESRRLDLGAADAADMALFNRILWMAVKGEATPYPGARRMSLLEARRSR